MLPSKLCKILGNFLGILNFKLHSLCAGPLNLPLYGSDLLLYF